MGFSNLVTGLGTNISWQYSLMSLSVDSLHIINRIHQFNTNFVQLKDSCDMTLFKLTDFNHFWPLIPARNNRDLVLTMLTLHAKYDICQQDTFYKVCRVWPQMAFDFHQQLKPCHTLKDKYMMYIQTFSKLPFMRYKALRFTIWPLLTFDLHQIHMGPCTLNYGWPAYQVWHMAPSWISCLQARALHTHIHEPPTWVHRIIAYLKITNKVNWIQLIVN